ncbi:hypothetical protein GCM10010872_38320 [Dyella flava]|nr:hypothetical protein GCM10010872_38320 [Dyella flava]
MGLLFGGPGMPEEGFKLPAYRSTTVRPELAYRPITVRPEEVEDLSVGKVGSTPTAEIKKQLSTEGAPPSSLEHAPSTSSPASRPEDFELKNLDTRHLTSRFNIYYRPGENQEYVQVDGKWYATAEEQGQRFVYQPNEEGVASTWPLREDNGEWRFASLHELPGRPILSVERIPSSYRVDVPTDLQDADAQGVYRAGGQEYIKMDGLLYRSGQDGTGRYIYDSNPSHRIAVQRSDQGWTFTPPSRGLGGGAETPTETVKEVFDMTTERAQAFLSQYRFDAEGPYTERNFVRELNDTFQVPGWADRFRVEVGASSLPAIPAMASHPAPPGGRDVINPISGQLIHIDKGGYLNSSGFIERKDVPQVYRAIDSVTAGRNDPTQVGFRKSYRFRGVSKMIRGPSVIASADRHGPDEIFGVLEDWLDHYAIYRIDAKGLKSVSLRENIKSNPGVMEQVFNLVHGVLSKINAIPDEASRTQLLDDLTIGAYSANEVHVENEYLDPSRVSFEEGSITFELPWSEDVSSPDSAKTWTPPGTRATPSPAGTTISFPPEAGPSKSIPRIG